MFLRSVFELAPGTFMFPGTSLNLHLHGLMCCVLGMMRKDVGDGEGGGDGDGRTGGLVNGDYGDSI